MESSTRRTYVNSRLRLLLAGLLLVMSVASMSMPAHAATPGSVVAWGRNEYGQTSVPSGLSGVTAIAAGFWHTVALVSAPVNRAPSALSLSSSSVAENSASGTTVGSFTTTDPDAGDSHTYSLVAGTGSTDNASFSITGSTLQTTASFDFETTNSYTIRVRATDTGGLWFENAFTITVTDVNEAPTASAPSVTTVEDQAQAITLTGSDPDGHMLTYSVVASPSNGSLSGTAPNLIYTPAVNSNGPDSFTFQVNDGTLTSTIATVSIGVIPVNDVPSFTTGANQAVLANAGAQSVVGWACAISAGPANESSQTVAFLVSNTNTALFSAQPAIASNGTLTYTPAANARGSATVTVSTKDNGGTANGGVDTSAAQTFTITVTAGNNAPTIAVAAGGTCASAGGTMNLTIADLETAAGSLTLSSSSSNTKLVPNANITFGGSGANRTITITAAAKQSGSATVTVTVSDGELRATIAIGVIIGTTKNETLTGGAGSNLILGVSGLDTITGGTSNDLLCGGTRTDTINGGGGADTLNGGNGNDTLNGGNGNDTLTGGLGGDVFSGGAGTDKATDFTPSQGDTKDSTLE